MAISASLERLYTVVPTTKLSRITASLDTIHPARAFIRDRRTFVYLSKPVCTKVRMHANTDKFGL